MRTLTWLMALAALAACEDNRTFVEAAPPAEGELPALADCTPNLDGVIDAIELAPAIDVSASYRVTPAGSTLLVDLVGEVDGNGGRRWDWSSSFVGEQALQLQAVALDAQWYAGSFEDHEGNLFVTPMDVGGATEGVYAHREDALYLLGMASAQEHPATGQTLLVYEPPVALLRFPLTVGDAWEEVGKVSHATFAGLPYFGEDTYEVSVTRAGELVLPDLTFTQALQVHTKVKISPSVSTSVGASITRRQVSMLFECFGEVARVVSKDDETAEDFDTAGEIRRLGL